jgi:hypothetical protein
MKDENRIVELLADMIQEQKITNQRLIKLETGMEKLEKQQAKTNIAIGELRLSVMKLADKFETVSQHDKRITRLEDSVFHH